MNALKMNIVGTQFLREFHKYRPHIDNYSKWAYITIDHRLKKEYNVVKDEITKQIKSHSGYKIKCIYIYKIPQVNRPLYIGKSQNLIGRVLNHYKEIYDPNIGFLKWKKFWRKNKNRMRIYYLPIESENIELDETIRKLIESLLTLKHKPFSIEV